MLPFGTQKPRRFIYSFISSQALFVSYRQKSSRIHINIGRFFTDDNTVKLEGSVVYGNRVRNVWKSQPLVDQLNHRIGVHEFSPIDGWGH